MNWRKRRTSRKSCTHRSILIFLYNSLSLINSKAIISGQDEISNMVLLLSTFYRTALNKGKDMTTLENELLNIQSYVQIQLLSYSEPIPGFL